MGIYDTYSNLHDAERNFIWAHPGAAIDFDSNANVARHEAVRRFASSGRHNGSADAFRHCFWSSMNARDQGRELAKEFGDAHENFAGNPAAEKAMDLHNNGVGYDIGAKAVGASNRHLAVLCVEAWTSGKLVQIQSQSSTDLVYSNSTETYLYGGKP
jgi:hypothetical protein